MLDVLTIFLSNSILNGFSVAAKNAGEVHADVVAAHAQIRKAFGDEVSLEDGLQRIRDASDHPLRPLVDWFDGPRLVKMSAADEYREAAGALNRAAMEAQKTPTLDNIFAWLFAWSRYQRAQAVYPLSKPVEPIERSRRIKAAAPLEPDDFSEQAQAAIIELCNGDRAAGHRTLATLVAHGGDPGGHIASLLCKVDDGHWKHLNVLATRIAMQTYIVSGPPVLDGPASGEPGPHFAAVDTQAATAVPEQGIATDPIALAAAVTVLDGWVKRAWNHISAGFHNKDGLWIFGDAIRNRDAAAAYPVAGRSEAFQAILRDRLGDPS